MFLVKGFYRLFVGGEIKIMALLVSDTLEELLVILH